MVSLRRHFVPNPVPSSETRFALRSKSPLFLHTRYDAAGEETGETQQIAGLTPTITFSDQYTAGNRTQLAASIGGTNDFVNNYQYQSVLGQMSQVTQTGNGGDAVAAKTVTFAYDRLGEFTGISRYQNADATANLVAQAAYGYDLNGNLTSLVYSKANSTLPSYSWTYDSLGNMTSSSETLGSIVDAVSYTSDSTGQLLSATATSGPPSESYSYDSNGNRETVTTTGGQVTCITGPNNELLYDGTYYYQYDADGNQVARWVDNNGVSESSPQPNDTDITIYTWDNRNRLTSVTSYANYDAYIGTGDYTSPTPEQTVTYMYDVFNRWIGETITNYASGVVTSVNKTAFVYDGNQIVLQFDNTTGAELAATDLSHRYLWGPAVDQLLADEQVTNGLSQSGTVVWTFTDNENTVRDLATYSNGTTTVVNHREFSAYGELLSQTNTSVSPATVATVDCLFAYTGRALDEATGLQNNDNRWYDATTGRWFSQDPIGFWGGTSNLYRYCGNSPTSRTDSNGESSWNPYNPEFYSSIWKPNSPPPAAPAPPPPAAPAPPPPAAPAPPPPGPSRGGSSAGEWCEHVAPVAAQGVLDAAAEAAHTTAAPFDVAFELIKATPDFANVLVSQAVKNAAADALAHPEHYNRQQLDQVYVWVHRLQDVEGRRQLQHCD